MRRPLRAREQKFVGLARELGTIFAERAREYDADASFPYENYEDMKSSGFLRLTVPEELGGMGANLYETMLALEELASHDSGTTLAVNMHLAPIGQWAAIWRITKSDPLEDVLKRAGEGSLIWAGFTSEPGIDNIITGANTKAIKVDGGFKLSGHKIFCTNISVATDFSITAQYDNPETGPELIMVKSQRGADGLEPIDKWDVMGMRCTRSGELKLVDHFVPDNSIIHRQPIGKFNEVIARTILCWGVTSFGAVYSGIGAGAIDWAKSIVEQRGRQNDPYIRNLFAEMQLLLETGRSVAYRHAHEVAEGDVYEQLSIQENLCRSAMAKIVPVDNAVKIMNKVVEAVGAPAYQLKYPFEREWRNAQAGPLMPFSTKMAHQFLAATTFGEEIAPTAPSEELDLALGRAN